MSKRIRKIIGLVSIATLAVAACGSGEGDGSPDVAATTAATSSSATVGVSEAWSRQPAAGQSTAAVYAVVSNPTDSDVTIVSVSSPVTDRAELHETITNDDGTMKMQQVTDGFVVPAGGEFVFESGGPHIMLFDIDAASYPSDQVEVTLQFDGADPITFDAEVRPLLDDGADMGDTSDMGDMGGDMTADTGSMDMSDDGVVHVAVSVADGSVTTDSDRVEVALGSMVELTVTADVTDEVHVHGYDLHGDVTPSDAAVVTFTADVPGVFEVELEDAGIVLVELQVS